MLHVLVDTCLNQPHTPPPPHPATRHVPYNHFTGLPTVCVCVCLCMHVHVRTLTLFPHPAQLGHWRENATEMPAKCLCNIVNKNTRPSSSPMVYVGGHTYAPYREEEEEEEEEVITAGHWL